MFKRVFHRSARRHQRPQLGMLPLSERVVPAVLVTTYDLDGDGGVDDIRIVGDAQNSIVTVHDNGLNQLLVTIDANGNGSLLDPGDKQQSFNFNKNSIVVEAFMGLGKDTFQYVADTDLSSDTRTFFLNMGLGNDTVNWDMNGKNVLSSSRVNLEFLTGDGNDTANVDFNEVRNAFVMVNASMGNQGDVYNLDFGKVDDKASVDVQTDLGAGLNTHNFVLQSAGFSDKADVNVAILGGAHADVVNVKLNDDVGNGTIASRFDLLVNLYGGNDTFEAVLNQSFRVDDHSQASLKVLGGLGNDNLGIKTVGSGDLRIDPDALLSIDLQGEAGNDTLTVSIPGGVQFDLLGAVRLRLDGGLGNDKMAVYLANTTTSTGMYDIVVKGSYGNDETTFVLTNNGAAAITLGPAAGVIIDGGQGQDVLNNGSPNYTIGTNNEVVL